MPAFVRIDKRTYPNVADVERDAYRLREGLYDDTRELKRGLGKQAARRYSFLIKDGDYQGFCLASLQQSIIPQFHNEEVLYISDFAVRKDGQGRHYGLSMAKELLKRADSDGVSGIEFHARGSTSYSAISESTSRDLLLRQYGFSLDEYGESEIFSNGSKEDSLHLISLRKDMK